MPDQERLALFIDGANLYATAKSLGFDIDYKRLLREFQSRGRLIRAFYYTALIDDQEYSSIRPLGRLARLQRLLGRHQAHQGIRRLDRPAQSQRQHGHRTGGDGDGAGAAYRSDGAVLRRRRLPLRWSRRCSGKGVRVVVVSTVSTQPPMVADELRRQADEFIDLAQLVGAIGRDPGERAARAGEPRRSPASVAPSSSVAARRARARVSGRRDSAAPSRRRSARDGVRPQPARRLPRLRPARRLSRRQPRRLSRLAQRAGRVLRRPTMRG